MRRRSPSVALSLAASLSLPFFVGVPAAFAEPTTAELTTARELFDQGMKLEEKNQWKDALERFRKVAAIKTTPAVRFHVGLCLENTGKLVDALNEFERAQSEASADSSPTGQTVAKNSQKHIEELRERIPRVTIQIPEGAKDVAITIDGSNVSALDVQVDILQTHAVPEPTLLAPLGVASLLLVRRRSRCAD